METVYSKLKSQQKQGVEPIERATYTVEEAARILGIGRATAYKPGVLPTIRVGGRLLVPRAALRLLLESV
jgi:excisionase family DNA binding protein